MSFRSNIFGQMKTVPNLISTTFMEGIGTTTTKSLLASKLGIAEANILEFLKEGDSITAKINAPYNLPSQFPTKAFKDVEGQAQKTTTQGYLRSGIQVFYSTSLNALGARTFLGTGSLAYCVIPNVVTVDPYPGYYIFDLDGKPNLNQLTVCFPLAWQTSNAGNPHQEAQYVIDNGGTVTYGNPQDYDFLITKPSKPTNLNLIAIKGTLAKFSFTSTTSVNPILRHEIYINGVYKGNVKVGEDYVSFDLPSTQYSVTIQTVDTYFNRSILSTPLIVNTLSEAHSGLNSIYELQGASPGIIADSYVSGNGIVTGEYTQGVLEGKVKAKAIYLGLRGSIQVPNKGITKKATFNIWMRKEFNADTYRSGFARFNNSNAQGHYRYSNNNIYSDNFSSVRKTMGSGLIADITTAMHMVTITADQDTNQWKFYQNGVLYTTSSVGDLFNNIWDIFEIGTSGLAFTSPTNTLSWYGWAEQIMFFHKALTQTEIDYWYNGGLGRVPVLT